MKIKIWDSKKGKEPWRWHFVGGNGEIVAPTEPRPTLNAALASAKRAVRGIVRPFKRTYILFVRKENKDGSWTLTWE